jgi:hypothetical protein
MNYRQTRSVLGAIAVAAALTAGSAHAGGLTILPDAISLEYFGLNFANNILTSQTIGTLDYGGHPGCGGICVATTALGASPSVSVQVNEVVYQATGGGAAQATLGYYVEYVNTPGTYAVDLHASDLLSPQGSVGPDDRQHPVLRADEGEHFAGCHGGSVQRLNRPDLHHGRLGRDVPVQPGRHGAGGAGRRAGAGRLGADGCGVRAGRDGPSDATAAGATRPVLIGKPGLVLIAAD